jgi:hypothetical protein
MPGDDHHADDSITRQTLYGKHIYCVPWRILRSRIHRRARPSWGSGSVLDTNLMRTGLLTRIPSAIPSATGAVFREPWRAMAK